MIALSDCSHRWETRRREIASGALIAGQQCLDCGSWRAVPKSTVPDLGSRPWYDPKIADCYWSERSDSARAAWADEREDKRRAWFEEHSRYLLSPEWRKKADRVLRRAGHVCEACLERRATQVHHLTYEHWKNEPLFDLRAVCAPCHEAITEMDRSRRGA